MLAGCVDFLQIPAELILQLAIDGFFLQHLGVAENGVQWRPELVTHVREEQALRLIGGLRGFLRLGDLFLGPSAFGDILHRQHQQLSMVTRLEFPGVEQHHTPPNRRKVMLQLEVVEHGALGNDVFEERP